MINETFTTMSNDCINCKNNDICCYREEKFELDNKVYDIKSKMSKKSPIKITCVCERFENETRIRGDFHK